MALPCRIALGAFLASTACEAPSGDGSSDTTGATTTADSASEAPIDCQQYVSTTEIGPSVTVNVRHEAVGPVYYVPQGCAGAIGFDITAKPSDETVRYFLGECAPVLCDAFVGSSSCHQTCNNCAPPVAGRIGPGGVAAGSWSGAWLLPFEMPEQCAPGASCQDTCQRQDQAAPGRYEIALTIHHVCTGTCECEDPAPDSVCNLEGGAQLGYPETFTTVIDYPEQTVAEIVITN